MVYESKIERLNRLACTSIMDWTRSDYKFMGYYKRSELARNGDPLDSICSGNPHKYNLDEENGIIYLTCSNCTYTAFLKEKDNPRVQTNRKERDREFRFRSIRA